MHPKIPPESHVKEDAGDGFPVSEKGDFCSKKKRSPERT